MAKEDVLHVLDRHLAVENTHESRRGCSRRSSPIASSSTAPSAWGGAGMKARPSTHAGAFAGVPSTGRPVELSVAVVVDFRDYWDAAGLARQLGVAALDVAASTAMSMGGRSA
jgi:hypothetical protein